MRNFQLPGRSTVHSTSGMVASSSPQASLAAIDVLRAGGNAVDAAVTACAVLCVTEPHMTGIGGDCFALVSQPDGKIVAINGSGRAPRAADAVWLEKAGLEVMPGSGALSVTVPGAIDAWDVLLRRFGTQTLGEALNPAIRLAENGVPVLPRVAHDWAFKVDFLARDEGARLHYLPNGRSPSVGEVMRYPALAETLRIIARTGRDAFYCGEIAEDIVACIQAQGGLITTTDFESTKANFVEPLLSPFQGHEVIEIPPNGQGITALAALNIVSKLNLGRIESDSPERRHLEIEAMRRAWELRNRFVGDPDYCQVPVEQILADETALSLARSIRREKAMPGGAMKDDLPASDTVYLCVVDKERRAVSFINSLYSSFGSGLVTVKTGITLQNRAAGFVTDVRHPNCIAPGKRPLHTLMPGMVRKDGKVVLAFGVMGGNFQPMGHLTVVVNKLLYHMDVQEALDYPRVMPLPGCVVVEDGVRDSVVKGLIAKGHVVQRAAEPLGGGQIIEIDPAGETLTGGSDSRKDGQAIGY